MIIKYSQFALNTEVSETDFLMTSDKMQDEFYSKHESLKRRELLKTKEKTWIERPHAQYGRSDIASFVTEHRFLGSVCPILNLQSQKSR